MLIDVNGVSVSTSAETLRDLLEELGYGQRTIATALNGEVVAATQRYQRRLKEHDRIEIVAPRQGG